MGLDWQILQSICVKGSWPRLMCLFAAFLQDRDWTSIPYSRTCNIHGSGYFYTVCSWPTRISVVPDCSSYQFCFKWQACLLSCSFTPALKFLFSFFSAFLWVPLCFCLMLPWCHSLSQFAKRRSQEKSGNGRLLYRSKIQRSPISRSAFLRLSLITGQKL